MLLGLDIGTSSTKALLIDEQGDVTVSTAMLDQGAGTHTAMRLVAAEELQLPLEKVRVATLDTSEVGPDTGIGASRGTRIFGNATRLASVNGLVPVSVPHMSVTAATGDMDALAEEGEADPPCQVVIGGADVGVAADWPVGEVEAEEVLDAVARHGQ